MTKHSQREPGPTWSDIHDYCERLQSRWNAHIVFVTRFYPAGRTGSRSAQVVVEARESAKVGAPVRAMGYASFRGGSGAATMPAAMYVALCALEGKLEGLEDVSQARMAF